MKKVLFILFVLILTACSDKGETLPLQGKDEVISIPVENFPNTPGSYWKYAYFDSLSSTADTVLVSVSENFSAGDTTLWEYHFKTGIDSQFVVNIQDTVKIFEYRNYEYPRYVIIFPLQVGTSWKNRFYADSVVTVENIPVLGKTLQAYIIRENWGNLNDYGTITSWIVPGIGMVKKVHTGYSFGAANNTWTLLGFTIQDKM